MVKLSVSRVEDAEFDSRLRSGDFSGLSYTSDLLIGIPVATWQVSGVEGSALGLVGPMLVYCDWVRNFDLLLLSQCGSMYNCVSGSVPEII